jgi:hypothetical protein
MRGWQDLQYFNDIFQKAHNKVLTQREEANTLIVDLWNEIEESHKMLEPQEAREKSAVYGVKYVYRKNEKIRPFRNVNYGIVS